MDGKRFDDMSKVLGTAVTRQSVFRFLAGIGATGLTALTGFSDADAKKGKGGKKRKRKGAQAATSEHVCVCHKGRQVVCPDDDGVLNGHLGHGDCICAGQPGGDPNCNCSALEKNADCTSNYGTCPGGSCEISDDCKEDCDCKDGKCVENPKTCPGQPCKDNADCDKIQSGVCECEVDKPQSRSRKRGRKARTQGGDQPKGTCVTKCVPEPKEKTCKDKCGEQTNNCDQKVDCGPCDTCPGTCRTSADCPQPQNDGHTVCICPDSRTEDTKQCEACEPESKEQTCSGKCGEQRNNCGQKVDCGPCDVCPGTCHTNADCPQPKEGATVCICPQGRTDTRQCEACEPESKEQTCKDKCGEQTNNCGQKVDCGPCDICPGTCRYDKDCPQPRTGNGVVCICSDARNGDHKQCEACEPESKEQTCSGKCGEQVNNCHQKVDCGPCDICPGTCKTSADCPQPQNDGHTVCICPNGESDGYKQCEACEPESKEKTCEGKCGEQTNNCGQKVDCGDCDICPGTCETSADCPQPKEGATVCICPDVDTNGRKQCEACIPEDKSKTCEGKCGEQINNCGQRVDCGPCDICPGTCKTSADCPQPKEDGGTVCVCSDTEIDGRKLCEACEPESKDKTCKDKCGEQTNNCGQKVDCGSCEVCSGSCVNNPAVCRTLGANCFCGANGVCQTRTCRPTCPTNNCTPNLPDGCGGICPVVTCPAGRPCNPATNTCGPCTFDPNSCQANGRDLCGNSRDNCGSPCVCPALTVCNAQGICEPFPCVPETIEEACAGAGRNCGIVSDGCTGNYNCGDCTGNQQCLIGVCKAQGGKRCTGKGHAGAPCRGKKCRCKGGRQCHNGTCCEQVGDGSLHCNANSDCCPGLTCVRKAPGQHKVCLRKGARSAVVSPTPTTTPSLALGAIVAGLLAKGATRLFGSASSEATVALNDLSDHVDHQEV